MVDDRVDILEKQIAEIEARQTELTFLKRKLSVVKKWDDFAQKIQSSINSIDDYGLTRLENLIVSGQELVSAPAPPVAEPTPAPVVETPPPVEATPVVEETVEEVVEEVVEEEVVEEEVEYVEVEEDEELEDDEEYEYEEVEEEEEEE
jgi:hypothetical protein|tara:strand:+ start:510 stop:953 length:444 start_codon:yes stop_codon:yes gene_type:complete